MPGLLLAQGTSDNAPGGAYFSLWFPAGLFIIVIAILWVLYSRPHRRVPPQPIVVHGPSDAHATGVTRRQGEMATPEQEAMVRGTGVPSPGPGDAPGGEPDAPGGDDPEARA